MTDIPEPWATALVEAGLVDPRGRDDRPSLRQLSERTGIATTTLSQMVQGGRRTRQDNIDRVADALRVDPRKVAEWVGRARTVAKPYDPPPVASLLDERERKAIDEVINLLARGKMDDAKKMSAGGGAEPTQSEPSPDQIATGKRARRRRTIKRGDTPAKPHTPGL